MKKIRILFVNIFIFVFIFLAADYIFGYHVYCLNFDKKINIFKFSKIYIEHICDYDYYFKNNYRQTACPVTNSPPPSDFASDINQVILVGCSYTFGSSLEDEETFQYLLEKQINHPVYNLGICSGSPREILYILNDKRFLNSVVNTDFNNIKYIIYTFIPDHLHRLYFDPYIISPHFVVKKDKTLHPYLVYKKEINILRKFYLYQYYTQHIMYNIPNIYKK